MQLRAASLLALIASLWSCTCVVAPTLDAGPTDAGAVDAGLFDDAGVDAGSNVELDAGVDAGRDAGPQVFPVQVSVGGTFAAAVLSDGTLLTWGANTYGARGHGEVDDVLPERVPGLDHLIQVTAGYEHLCAVSDAGALWCWGRGIEGQLGVAGAPGDQRTPLLVVDAGVARAAAGNFFTCALHSDGSTSCWGTHAPGADAGLSRIPVETGLPPAAELVTGTDHACARFADGGVSCWGAASRYPGILGGAQQGENLLPTHVDAGAVFESLVAGGDSTCGQTASDAAVCWGELVGSTGLPQPMGFALPAVSAVGQGVLCLAARTGGVSCLGSNADGQLGSGDLTTSPTRVLQPVKTSDGGVLTGPVQALSALARSVCALRSGGDVVCWGRNTSNQLGNGELGYRALPVHSRLRGPVSVGFNTSCGAGPECVGHVPIQSSFALDSLVIGQEYGAGLSNGDVFGWGNNAYSNLGALSGGPVPQLVAAFSGRNTHVSISNYTTCAAAEDAGIRCLGLNAYGEFGGLLDADRTATPLTIPVPEDAGLVRLEGSYFHTCALYANDNAWCWGNNVYGQVAPYDGAVAHRPTRFLERHPVTSIKPGGLLTLALSGTQAYFGGSTYTRFGLAPAPIGSGTSAIAAGYTSGCLLQLDGGVSCFGTNRFGALGIGAPPMDGGTWFEATTPVPVPLADVVALSGSFYSFCAEHRDAGVSCWGLARDGQLGDDTVPRQPYATPVLLPPR